MSLVSSVYRRDTHEHGTSGAERTRQAASASWARFLWAYLRPFAGRFTLLAALLFGGIGLQLLAPQLVRAFIDATAVHAAQSQLLTLALLALGAAISIRWPPRRPPTSGRMSAGPPPTCCAKTSPAICSAWICATTTPTRPANSSSA